MALMTERRMRHLPVIENDRLVVMVSIGDLVKNIIAAWGRRIDALTWMTPATKAKAKEKLFRLYVGIGYTEKWRDYSRLSASGRAYSALLPARRRSAGCAGWR